ncbi:MAG: hypothetical protein CL959_01370 [Euryarchaeota archaeon]|nr:hypothetical protein [Euryarchaeota archaeon]|tara:strand:+ start:951 stop:2402 length:1452 start_codon:yes stop_codon:yes gene_type:complete
MNAELAFNEDDSKLYIGVGDNGAGVATSIITLGGPGAHVTLDTNQTISGDKVFSGVLNVSGTLQIGGATVSATAAEINYLSGVTSNVQDQVDAVTTDISQNRSAIGISDGDTHLGTFGGTGTTLSDNITVKAALEELETALEDGSGTVSADSGTAEYANGNLNINGGTGLTTTGDNSSTLTVSLDNTTVTPGTYNAAGSVRSFTVDQQGRLSAAGDVAIDITHDQVSDFDAGVQANRLDQLAAPTADVSLNNQKITGLATPTGDADAVTKGYVDSIAQGLDVKPSVKLATTTNITLSGTSNGVDGQAISAGNRILVKNQTSAAENGIYVVQSGAWVRADDFDSTANITPGAFVFVEQGNTQADNGYVLVSDGAISVGVDDIEFEQFSGAGQITAGNGLEKSGNTLYVGLASNKGIKFDVGSGSSLALDLSHSAIDGTLAVGDGGTGVSTLTGLVKGNGVNAFSAAVDGTDYLSPSATIDGGTF